MAKLACAVDGCSTVASRKGWCDKHYRRWLRRGGVDVVHHVDEDKSNNAANNLVICPNRAYHAALHKRMRQLNWSVK